MWPPALRLALNWSALHMKWKSPLVADKREMIDRAN